jgi:hypothetical protein
MRKAATLLAAMATVLVAVTTADAGAVKEGRFIGTPSCTADNAGRVSCDARVAGLPDGAGALVLYQTEWHCTAIPSIEVIADNALSAGAYATNGREFTVWNMARFPTFYEVLFQTNFGCPDEAWTAVRYTSVSIALTSGLTYSVGTLEP